MFVEIDSIKGLITKVNKTEAGYDPQPNKIEAEVISSGSRSKFQPKTLNYCRVSVLIGEMIFNTCMKAM